MFFEPLSVCGGGNKMRTNWLCLVAALFPAALAAGQVYGTVTAGGKPVNRVSVTIRCGGAVTSGTTVDDGSYRINVPQQGRCTLELTGFQGGPSAEVFSYANPARYDFDLVHLPDGRYQLRRR
jgi:hypothetical protein